MKPRTSTKLLFPLLVMCVATWITSHFYFGSVAFRPSRSLGIALFIERGMVGTLFMRSDGDGFSRIYVALYPIEEYVTFVLPKEDYDSIWFGSDHRETIFGLEDAWYCPWWFVFTICLALLLTLELRSRRRMRVVTATEASPG
ncbi:MAG TPA: hypothetical protein VF184_00075 [Phycisphaeraceae bacterium]